MHAHACEALESFLHEGAIVLDVGSGSGYLAAVSKVSILICLH